METSETCENVQTVLRFDSWALHEAFVSSASFLVYLTRRKNTPQIVKETVIRELEKFYPVPESEKERIIQVRRDDLQAKVDELQEDKDDLINEIEQLEIEKQELEECLDSLRQEGDEIVEYYENQIEYIQNHMEELSTDLDNSKKSLREKIDAFQSSS